MEQPAPPTTAVPDYALRYSVDYPDHPLNRLTTFFRWIVAIPILIVLATLGTGVYVGVASALLFVPPLLMIVFRQKYPRWWFDWNRELLRFTARVYAYLLLLRDEYPSTDEEQAVHLDMDYPDAKNDLNRWLPLVKWFLAIPHFVVLLFIYIGGIACLIIAWFAILFTGRYPRALFDYIVGMERWTYRVAAYAFLLVTDKYPPFKMEGASPARAGQTTEDSKV